MTDSTLGQTLERVLDEEIAGLEALELGLEQALEAMRTDPVARLQEAIAVLERQALADLRRGEARERALARFGAAGARLSSLIAEVRGEAGEVLRTKACSLRQRLERVVKLSRRLAFVVTQVLRVNAEVLRALGHPGADSDAYDRLGARTFSAGGPGALRAEA